MSAVLLFLAIASVEPQKPWPPPEDGCIEATDYRDVYEVVDPKDPTVNLREHDTTTSAILAQMPNGTRVLDASEGASSSWRWVIVAVPGPVTRGFLPKKDVEKDSTRHVLSSRAPWPKLLYAEAATTSKVIHQTSYADVKVLGERGDFVEVELTEAPKNVAGYVHKSRLKFVTRRGPSFRCEPGDDAPVP